MPTRTSLTPRLRSFIEAQKMFFVATADREGRVNVSPKGMDTLIVQSESSIRWLNLTGSGNETAAHVRSTGRMTLMFCAFQGSAMILRVYGTAKVFHPGDPDWDARVSNFAEMAGSRQVFDLSIDLVQTSCGTGVPLMAFQKSRGEEELLPFYEEMDDAQLHAYWRKKNSQTVDGFETGILATKG